MTLESISIKESKYTFYTTKVFLPRLKLFSEKRDYYKLDRLTYNESFAYYVNDFRYLRLLFSGIKLKYYNENQDYFEDTIISSNYIDLEYLKEEYNNCIVILERG